jgi:hypothetical protein
VPETANEQTTTPCLGSSEIEDENEDFHSEGEVDISEVDTAVDHHKRSNIHLGNVEMVDKDTPQVELIDKDGFQCRYCFICFSCFIVCEILESIYVGVRSLIMFSLVKN